MMGLSSGGEAGSVSSAETLRDYVIRNYYEVQFLGGQVVGAGGMSTPGVEFNWKADSDITRGTRTAFFPTATGILKFTLTTSPEEF